MLHTTVAGKQQHANSSWAPGWIGSRAVPAAVVNASGSCLVHSLGGAVGQMSSHTCPQQRFVHTDLLASLTHVTNVHAGPCCAATP